MKKKLIALVLMLALVLTFGLVACGEESAPAAKEAGFAAQLTYGTSSHCGLAFVEATGNTYDKVQLNEAFIPNEWAKVNIEAYGEEFEEGFSLPIFFTDRSVSPSVVREAPYTYSRFILITLQGVTTLYEGKPTAVSSTNGAFTAGNAGSAGGTATSVIRYYRVTELTVAAGGEVTSTAEISLENSFENTLNNQETAKAYIKALRAFENQGENVDTSSFVQYVASFGTAAKASLSAALGSAEKLNTERLHYTYTGAIAARTATAEATEGFIAIGGGSEEMDASQAAKTASNWSDNNDIAYASTFFKLGSTYSGHFYIEGLTVDNTGRTAYDALRNSLLVAANQMIAAGKTEGITAAAQSGHMQTVTSTELGSNIQTGASTANTAIYLKIMVTAILAWNA